MKSFLPYFEGGWEFRRWAPEAVEIWRLVMEFLACPLSRWLSVSPNRTSFQPSDVEQSLELVSVKTSLPKNDGIAPPQIPRQYSVELLA